MIRHPYGFVRFPQPPVPRFPWGDRGPSGHERFYTDRQSGTLVCELEAITPLCIRAHFKALRGRNGEPWLPGSSLRGLIRTTMQMLGAGCAGLQFPDKKDKEAEKDGAGPLVLAGLEPCTKEEACLVCRLFGYSVQGEKAGWAALVRFHDSKPARVWEGRWVRMNDRVATVPGRRARWQDQGTGHTAFYFPVAARTPAGWKVYRHAKYVLEAEPEFASDDCVDKDTVFEFQVQYENLTPEELGLFKFAITLAHECPEHSGDKAIGLAHKFGYGKSAGMGSCRIRIVEDKPVTPWLDLGEGAAGVTMPAHQSGCELSKWLGAPQFKDLCDALDPRRAGTILLFPSFSWFRSNPRKTVADYEAEPATQNINLTAPPPPAPPPPPVLDDVVEVKITRIRGNRITAETLKKFGGESYTYQAEGSVFRLNVEDVLRVEVWHESIDHRQRTFRGRIKS